MRALEAGVEAGVELKRSYVSVVHESFQLAPETHRIYPRHTHESRCLIVVSGLEDELAGGQQKKCPLRLRLPK